MVPLHLTGRRTTVIHTFTDVLQTDDGLLFHLTDEASMNTQDNLCCTSL